MTCYLRRALPGRLASYLVAAVAVLAVLLAAAPPAGQAQPNGQRTQVGALVQYGGVRTGGPFPDPTTLRAAQIFSGPIRGSVTGRGAVRGQFEVNFSYTYRFGSPNLPVERGIFFFLATDLRGRLVGALAGNVTGGQFTGVLPVTGPGTGVFAASGSMGLRPTLGAGMFEGAIGEGALAGFCAVTDDPTIAIDPFFDNFNGRIGFDLTVPATSVFKFR